MNLRRKPKTGTSIQELIDDAQSQLHGFDVDSSTYDDALKQIERLHKLKDQESKGKKVSPDTLLIVLANLAGIMLILYFEKFGIITSKAFGLVMKTKV